MKPMKYLFLGMSACLLAACGGHVDYSEETVKSDLRAPAYPLLTLHPHVRLWSASDRLTDRNMTFTDGKELPFVGFLRVDGALYRFMGDKTLPPQAIAPMALDHERWEAKITSLDPGEGWEQPGFDDKYWNVKEGAFGTPNLWEVKNRLLQENTR